MFLPSEESTSPEIPLEFKRAHVVIADDDLTNRVLLHGVCEKLGIGIIDEAKDGLETIDLTTKYRPDLILLDIHMPRMNGIDVMKHLRSDPVFDYLPILVQTSLQGSDDRVACFNAGATDVISRPFHLPELKARIRAHLRSAISSRVLFDFRNRIQAHLEITHDFLNTILPTKEQINEIEQKYNLSCQSVYRTHDEIGGDLWTLRVIDENRLALIVIDASAHGLAGAINALRVDCLVQVFQEFLGDPAQFINRLDAAMAKISFGQLFAGAVVLVFDKRSGELTFAGSGNPSPLLCRRNQLSQLRTGGMLIGSGLVNLKNQTVVMEPSDTLVVFSDGWMDNQDIDTVWISNALRDPLENLAESLARNNPQPIDDLTLITLQRRN